MKVYNMYSPKSGRPVANQFIINCGSTMGTWFQSYGSTIAVIKQGIVTLDEKYWDYSRTTGKYRNIFLSERKSDTLSKINLGIYKLANLNS